MNFANALAACGMTIAATAVVIASPIQAQPMRNVTVVARQSDNFTRQVSYADLNLASNADVQALNRRVDAAVDDVCHAILAESYQDTMQACAGDSRDRVSPQIARAIQRAHEIAATGSSSIAAAAITIGVGD